VKIITFHKTTFLKDQGRTRKFLTREVQIRAAHRAHELVEARQENFSTRTRTRKFFRNTIRTRKLNLFCTNTNFVQILFLLN